MGPVCPTLKIPGLELNRQADKCDGGNYVLRDEAPGLPERLLRSQAKSLIRKGP